MTHLDEIRAAALDLARAARWPRALALLDSAPADPAETALTAAEVALESDWFGGTALAAERLATAERLCGPSWDLDFFRLRDDYLGLVKIDGEFRPGPDGKDPQALDRIRAQAYTLADEAPDEIRHGWARMYLGLILDNLIDDRSAAPEHYNAALAAGEKDDLLAREALRHLGDHDRDDGDLTLARERWERATTLGARNGLVCGTLSQQILLAVIARDEGDEPGARKLATEIARWSAAIGAPGLHAQATALLRD
jgi:hypothetical protein